MMKKIMTFSALVLSAQVAFADSNYDRYDDEATDTSMSNSCVFSESNDNAKLKKRASYEDLVKSFSNITRESDDGYASDEDEETREEVFASQKQTAEEIQDKFTQSQSGYLAQSWGFAKKAASVAYGFISRFF